MLLHQFAQPAARAVHHAIEVLGAQRIVLQQRSSVLAIDVVPLQQR